MVSPSLSETWCHVRSNIRGLYHCQSLGATCFPIFPCIGSPSLSETLCHVRSNISIYGESITVSPMAPCAFQYFHIWGVHHCQPHCAMCFVICPFIGSPSLSTTCVMCFGIMLRRSHFVSLLFNYNDQYCLSSSVFYFVLIVCPVLYLIWHCLAF